MTERTIIMSHKELERITVVERCTTKALRQQEGAGLLGISTRQLRRLIKRFRENGVAGLASQHRGHLSNNRIAEAVRLQTLELVRSDYLDFGPTLAHEYLTEQHGLAFSVETLRQWMIVDGLWYAKQHRANIHQSRARRDCYGELIQIDGSPHDWFEGRRDKCTLIVFIDDATGKLMQCYFSPTETTESYMMALSDYLNNHGRPLALYSDRHSIFSVNSKGKEHELTQFRRATKAFDIELILAKTPQAKGRVERVNKTLQDRLVKALRLANISSIDEANAFLPSFINDFNQRFAVTPKSVENLHRSVIQDDQEKYAILSLQTTRRLTKNLTISYKGIELQLKSYGKGYRLRHQQVTVCEHFDGEISLYCEGKSLIYERFDKGQKAPLIASEKELETIMAKIRKEKIEKPKYKPSITHPWRQYPQYSKKEDVIIT